MHLYPLENLCRVLFFYTSFIFVHHAYNKDKISKNGPWSTGNKAKVLDRFRLAHLLLNINTND